MSIKSSKLKKFLKILAIFLIVIFVLFAGFLIYLNAKISRFGSSIAFNKSELTSAYSKPEIFDIDNNVINFANTNSISKIENLSENTKNAFIAIEDKNFYKHHGFNYKRMIKATLTNIKSRYYKEGASTISQQLVKNTLLTSEKTIDRKLKEIALTKKLEKQFSKSEILEIYLNTIYFGNNNFGIENASLNYFKKHVNELSLNESATLAALIKSPTYYTNPENIELLNSRKNLVLKSMLDEKMISNDEYLKAKDENINLNYQTYLESSIAYQNGVLNEALEVLNVTTKQLYSGKYKIYTYFSPKLQKQSNDILKNSVNSKYESNSVVIDNKTRGILSFSSSISNGTNIKRQAGSVMKPILVYSPALEMNKIYLETPILDKKTSFNDYTPQNADGKFNGFVSVNKAIEKSLNIPAVKTLEFVGIENAKQISSKMGVNFTDENNLSMALGSSKNGHSLLSLSGAYSTFASGGNYIKPHFIKEIRDINGCIIYQENSKSAKVIRDDTAYLITKALKNVAKNGTAKKLSTLNFDIMSKTGTVGSGNIGQNSDAYNISATTNHTIGVWIGSKNNNTKNLLPQKMNGSTTPTYCVKCLVEYLYKDKLPQDFKKPNTIKDVEIDSIELNQNNKIVLANTNTPLRYRKTIESSIYNLPKQSSTNFISPIAPPFNLNYNKTNNSVEIEFIARDFEEYDIIKNGNKFKTISNINGNCLITDFNISFGKVYSYQIICKQIDGNKNEILSNDSSIKEIYIPTFSTKINTNELKDISNSFQNIFKKNKA